MKITNRSDYGDVETPLLRRLVAYGATVDVTEDQARRLLPQRENWLPADDAARAVLSDLDATDEVDQTAAWQEFVEDVAPQVLEENPVAPTPPFLLGGDAPLADVPPPSTETSTDPAATPLEPPATSARKAEWVKFADRLGIPTGGKTIREIQQLTGVVPAGDDTEGESS